METIDPFLKILVTLLIIMDPMGNLPFFMLFSKLHSRSERNRMAVTAPAAACAILIFFAVTGDHVLRWFSISLPAFQIAGGAVFLIYSLQMLGLIPSGIKTSQQEEHEGLSKEGVALVPLAIPLLAGPGAITAVLVWRQGDAGLPVLLAAIVAACLLAYLVFRFADWILRFMGFSGLRVVTRLMGLLLAVIAVQFMVDGLQQVFAVP